MRMNLAQVAQAAKARLLHPTRFLQSEASGEQEVVILGVASDSREVKPGDLFVCIQGEHTDGHLHAAAAVRAGAVAVLASHDPFEGEINSHILLTPVLLADDTVMALGQLGHAWRASFAGKVVGITGTAGKTTVKEMLAHVLSQAGPTARSPRNLNTQVGLPVSMLATDGSEQFWVMEAGISHAHDMDEIGAVLQPDLALILNVGAGHTQGLGIRGIAQHKAALLKYLAPDGMALVSADYPDLVKETRALCPTAIFFSTTGKQLSYRATYLGLDEAGQGAYRLNLDGLSFDVTCPLSGPYAAENVIAVAAVAHLLGLTEDDITQGLATATLPGQRFSRREIPGQNGGLGWTLIDDSYNSNPLSSARMLEAAAELAREKALVCVMGEMLELGELAEDAHIELGRQLASARPQAVFWVGGHEKDVKAGLDKEHYSGNFQTIKHPEEFLAHLEEWEHKRRDSKPGFILFKGSRGNRLERMVSVLEQRGSHAL